MSTGGIWEICAIYDRLIAAIGFSNVQKEKECVCMQKHGEVQMWEEQIFIPTYEVSEPDKNPLFLERRAYQGSSGKVYPLPVTEKIFDRKVEKSYQAVFLENDYLKVMVLPELGGRIQRALDKTNNYDFVYYNHVIKPALVGLAGPWISGGIEFNWPQHHRPSTFSPVDYSLMENEDGSKTVWVSEIDKMNGTKGMAGFTLYPDKAYIQIKGQVFNRTDIPQTFLWWANPAVPVNDHTFSVFPPDVHAVMDHGKRAVSTFPIATGEYYKYDYSEGIDISRYRNIAVPTSYMAYHSDFDFVGNYDEQRQAGLLHVADHHISPGKKQWTWGNSDFGQAWDRNLTDSDGPYIELMTGVFADNQPDFTWLKPYEEKTFTQYFMPYKGVGRVKNATCDASVNYVCENGKTEINVYSTSVSENAKIIIEKDGKIIFEAVETLSPLKALTLAPNLGLSTIVGTRLCIRDQNGKILVEYTPKEQKLEPVPDAAEPLPKPELLKSTEELYLAAAHLEQYRHATYEPKDYYLEGLKRDPTDLRLNNGYGLLQYRRGNFKESIEFFRRAIKKQEWKNPNPYHGESYFNLGLALLMLGKDKQAYDAFYKAVWSQETQGAAFYQMACLCCKEGKYSNALAFINKSLVMNLHNIKARTVKTAVLRKLAQDNGSFTEESLLIDQLDMGARYERALSQHSMDAWKTAMRGDVNNYLELSIDYAHMGLYDNALFILEQCPAASPMVSYYASYFLDKAGKSAKALEYCKKAEAASPDYCFPNKLTDILVLEHAIAIFPQASFAPYYLGNLLYDKKQYEEAVRQWEDSAAKNPSFSIVLRNLSIAYYNKCGKAKDAFVMIRRAFALESGDARLLLEMDQLSAKTGISVKERLAALEKHITVTQQRDDLYVEYITLLNSSGQFQKAYDCISGRKFHPWEGGEGKVSRQYVYSLVEMAKQGLTQQQPGAAVQHLLEALHYPKNLGEGKLPNTQDNIIHYYLGEAYRKQGDNEQAQAYWEKAAVGLKEPAGMMYYNDQPADTILYQGLACDRLGRPSQARKCYHKLVSYGEKHLFDEVSYDYFAVSLPDTMVYENDIALGNKIYCTYLLALGKLGLGDSTEAKKKLEYILNRIPDHQGAIRHLKLLEKQAEPQQA